MTQVEMPKPLRLRWNKYTGRYDISEDHRAAGDADLITTTQAEAYADARVRKALDQAEAKLMEMHEHAVKSRVPPDEDEDGWNTSCADRAIALGEAVLAIRALIQPQQ